MKTKTSFPLSWLFSPAVFLLGVLALLATWAALEPGAVRQAFDQGGYAPFELATVPVFLAIVPLVWWKCPFAGSRGRRAVLCAAVTCVALMAVVKELDLHLWVMQRLFPDLVGADGSLQNLVRADGRPLRGTPFKMPFLLNGAVPLAAKAFVCLYFAALFGVFAALLGYFTVPGWAKPSFFEGVFARHPVAWSVGCLGTSGVMVQLCDRMPSWLRHAGRGLETESVRALFTVLEEGGEMMLAVFACIAILQAHALYGRNGVETKQGGRDA